MHVVFPERDEALSPNIPFLRSRREAKESENLRDLQAVLGDEVTGKVHLRMPKVPSPLPPKVFTYVTNMDLQPEDMVIVVNNGRFRVGCVARIDAAAEISPADPIQYLWVVAKVDFSEYNENMARNKTIEDQLQTARKRNIQQSFRQEVLNGMEDGPEKAALLGLIGLPPQTSIPTFKV